MTAIMRAIPTPVARPAARRERERRDAPRVGFSRDCGGPRLRATLPGVVLLALFATFSLSLALPAEAQERRRQVRIFPPEELGMLEGPDREQYQKPDQVMDALGIADGSSVADLGAGGGWFTVRLARRVGPQGVVYAEDIQEQMIESIERRIQRESLRNVRTVLGKPSDPKLPASELDAVLIVDTFYEFEHPVELLSNVKESLKLHGRLGIVEFLKDGVGPGPAMEERVDESVVIANAEAAGLRLISRETFLPYQYLLVFGRAEAPPDSTGAQARRNQPGKNGANATRANSSLPPTGAPTTRPPESAKPQVTPPPPNRF
jgi:ubiquinone/menaquinone biosynthesis C-methylase UbiE